MLNLKTEVYVLCEVKMGLWNRIGSAISSGFKAGKKYISDNAGTIANIGLAAVNPVAGAGAGAGMAFARSKFGKQLWEQAKPHVSKAWNATKDFASKHADTIGKVAAAGLNAAAPALDAYLGVPAESIIKSGAQKIAKHYAKNDTGWGRFAKGFAGESSKSNLSSQIKHQSNASNESNGHIAAGYSISSTGNYNGKNRKKSWFLG